MTVALLIKFLNEIEDKNRDVYVGYNFQGKNKISVIDCSNPKAILLQSHGVASEKWKKEQKKRQASCQSMK